MIKTMGLFGIVNSFYKVKQVDNHLNENTSFDQWLSGFIDAEGNFQVVVERDKYARLMFRINLHIDDVNVLYVIKNHLGVGHV